MIDANKLKFKSGIDVGIRNLILKILKRDPLQRPSCLEILLNFDLISLMKEEGLEYLVNREKEKFHRRNRYWTS